MEPTADDVAIRQLQKGRDVSGGRGSDAMPSGERLVRAMNSGKRMARFNESDDGVVKGTVKAGEATESKANW